MWEGSADLLGFFYNKRVIFDPLPPAISGLLDRWLKDEVLVAHAGVVCRRALLKKGKVHV